MKDSEYNELKLHVSIIPETHRWPEPRFTHWQRLHEVANEARARVSRAHGQMDEIDRNSDLSHEGKERQRRKVAAQAVADLEASKTLERARESVRYVVEQWKRDDVSSEIAEAKAATLKALEEAEAGWQRAIDKIAERAGRTTGLNMRLRFP